MEAVNANNGGDGDAPPEKEVEATLRQRVSSAIAGAGGPAAVSKLSGIPKGTLEKYAAETATPSVVRAAKIARALGIRLDDLAAIGESSGPGLSPAADMVRLPVYPEVMASAGPGTVPASELADGVMAFDRRFLRDQGAVPEYCAVIWARGDSMMPTIPDGSALVVDRSQVEVADGCIMVLNVAGSLLVKRVQRLTSGEIRLISDNRDYEPEVLAQHQLEQLRVIGRVVYFGRTP